ncbi:MAG: hypothetical protein LVQ96_05505 [Thermoplasmatales archaeon]|nr:hypothetical protein [Thermoplasmatales archaeon]MCW6170608.1 hypothetical protein [Thermoplasmatales archaeon]
MPYPLHKNEWEDFSSSTAGDYTPLECLSIYRNRYGIRKAFRELTADLGTFPMRTHKETILRELLLVFSITRIIRRELLKGTMSSDLMKRYSV